MTDDPRDTQRFQVSQEAASALLGDADGLRMLLVYAETVLRSRGIDIATRIHLDIAEAIIDAHIEELTEPGLSDAAAQALRTDPRCAVVVAAVHYATARECPTCLAGDEPDAAQVLRWATDFARGAAPVA
ncbi:hypothetical protein [Flexivirga caeni]|uniref:Uncharacterized protein n=1 Tax=Flexivirga caeni TaxID=2294115 RepID=A0A3M9ML92_9MICO|nr:hypothetical protein [Flexivirga caeni]RNI25438.1 hypothetical protein EFY87_02125 [Flexivirga caeni]